MRRTTWSALIATSLSAAHFLGTGVVPLAAQQPPTNTSAPVDLQAGTYRLTLEDARQRALTNNKSLALARLNVEEKGHGTVAAGKDYFPKLLGTVNYLHFNDNLGSVVTVERGGRGLLPPGTRTFEASVLNQDTTLSSIIVAQPITKLIAVNAAVQLARADENIAQAKLDKGVRDVLSGVGQLYYGLLGAQRIEAALTLQAKLIEQLAGANPAPEVRIALLEVRQGLVQVRGQVKDLTNQLDDLLDLPPCTSLELVDPLPTDPPVRCEAEAVQMALACNPEVREAEQDIAKARAALQVAKMDYLPDVSVFGAYTNQTVASYIQPNIGTVGVVGSYTFWDWTKRRNVMHQREALIAVAQQNVQVTVDKVRLEARKAYGGFEQAREALKLSGDMVQARTDAEKGAADPVAVQTTKTATAKAQLEYMKAEITYRVAHAQLMGTISRE